MVTISKMFLIRNFGVLWLYLLLEVITVSGFERAPSNRSHANSQENVSGLASIFSPRMDFEQWKPLTGRGDPLRNDPTYDYEPPVLERVHYWADDLKPDRETHYTEKKSEVLMLGVSSRKPSVTPRQPLPPRRHNQFRQPPPKYEDFTYKLSDTYPMTILVPPPFPPPGHQPSLFILPEEQPLRNVQTKATEVPPPMTKDPTEIPDLQTSIFTLQPSNLIYQSSTINQNWIQNVNQTQQKVVSSDYAGWGPTTPIDDYDSANETHNLILNDHHINFSKHPYAFYKPMLSESPPPPEGHGSFLKTTFLPTALPPALDSTTTATAKYEVETTKSSQTVTWPTERTTYDLFSTNEDDYDATRTERATTEATTPQPQINILDMLGPMMSMPLVNGPERDVDNLYPHASESMQIFRETTPEKSTNIDTMQTMLPPPIENVSSKQPHQAHSKIINYLMQKKIQPTHDPYLNMRYTTPVLTTLSQGSVDNLKSTTESSTPMYLIIQGHSKVKTYGSKPTHTDDKHTSNNEIPKPNETNEVKHLHPKEKLVKKQDNVEQYRKSKARDLKSLIDLGHGSIEIQEANIGIKYDISDGSDVPSELYRKGIVENEWNYKKPDTISKNRRKRQIELEDLITVDEDTIEEYLYKFFEGNKNDTSITDIIAQAVNSEEASDIDELEKIDDNDNEGEDR